MLTVRTSNQSRFQPGGLIQCFDKMPGQPLAIRRVTLMSRANFTARDWPGKMRKKVWCNQGDIVLVSLRDFQDQDVHRGGPFGLPVH